MVEAARRFPSPSGTLYFSILKSRALVRQSVKGFRPLRGLSISQYDWLENKEVFSKVSVPFGDSLFLNEYDCNHKHHMRCSFRPLRGLSISQWKSQKHNSVGRRFRPLRGLSISQSPVTGIKGVTAPTFPSPSGTLYFSIIHCRRYSG